MLCVARLESQMETPKINWNKDETLAAAEKAPSLSALLEQEGFYEQEALRWLTHNHVAKFLDAVDAEEAKKLRRFAKGWYYKSDRSATGSFPLLDHLWALDPQDHRKKTYLGESSTSSGGRLLVAHLTAFEPDWIGRWWKWRFKGGMKSNDDTLTRVFIRALTEDDLRSHSSELSNEVLPS